MPTAALTPYRCTDCGRTIGALATHLLIDEQRIVCMTHLNTYDGTRRHPSGHTVNFLLGRDTAHDYLARIATRTAGTG
jgi:hypothetical protein